MSFPPRIPRQFPRHSSVHELVLRWKKNVKKKMENFPTKICCLRSKQSSTCDPDFLHIWNLLTMMGMLKAEQIWHLNAFPLQCRRRRKKNQFGSSVDTRNLFVKRFSPHKTRVKSWINMIYIVLFLLPDAKECHKSFVCRFHGKGTSKTFPCAPQIWFYDGILKFLMCIVSPFLRQTSIWCTFCYSSHCVLFFNVLLTRRFFTDLTSIKYLLRKTEAKTHESEGK